MNRLLYRFVQIAGLVLLCASAATAQDVSSLYASQLIGSRGLPLPNQTIAVCSQPAVTTTQPCSPLATLATSTTTSSGGVNPLTSDVNGNFKFYAAPGKYTVQVYGPQVSGQFVQADTLVGAAGPASVTNLTVSGTGTFTGAVIAANDNNIRIVDGVHYAQTAAGIQQAINDVPGGGEVYLPATGPNLGYTFGTGSSCITINKPLTLRGPNLHSPQSTGAAILVASGVSATQDIICVTPTGDADGIRLADFSIVPQSGTPGRYGVHLTGNACCDITRFSMERVEILQLGSYAIYAEGSGLSQGTPAISFFNHNVLVGGAVFANAGDLLVMTENQISGTGKLDWNWQAGATTLIFKHNNVTHLSGGIHIGVPAVAPIFEDNELEAHGTSAPCSGTADTGSNGAYLDIDGIDDIGARGTIIAQAVDVFHNSFQIVCGSTLNGMRINQANMTNQSGNRYGIGTTNGAGGPPYGTIVTANATRTHIRPNNWYDSTGAIANPAIAWNDSAPLGNNGTLIEVGGNGQTDKSLVYAASDGTDTFWGFSGQIFGKGNNGNNQIYNGFNNTAVATFNAAGLMPVTIGGEDLGATATPWTNLWLGTAATNNFKFQPASTTGARIITIADPLSPTTVALPMTIANGTAAMTTAAIAAGACGTTVTVAATGVLTTDTIDISHNVAATAANGGINIINAWPTAGNVNFNYCTSTANTPTAMTINWSVRRP